MWCAYAGRRGGGEGAGTRAHMHVCVMPPDMCCTMICVWDDAVVDKPTTYLNNIYINVIRAKTTSTLRRTHKQGKQMLLEYLTFYMKLLPLHQLACLGERPLNPCTWSHDPGAKQLA